MSKLKKFLSISIVVVTVFATVGLAAVPAAQALSSGTLIKASQPAVYYYASDGKRYVFPNEKTYFTWYSDFSGVVTITDAELASIQIGGNVTYKPGVKMVKITTDPTVYVVDLYGTLRAISSEEVAECLYGSAWSTMVQDVPDAFFTNYTVGDPLSGCGDFDIAAATAAATSINVDLGLSGGGTTPLPSGSVAVSLSADTPGAATVPTAASVEVLRINLKAGSSAAAISSLKLTSYGLNTSTDIKDVTLYNSAGTKLASAKNVNSDQEVTFTFATPLSISANSTLTVVVRATFDASGYYQLGVKAATDITSGGSVTGSFPVKGSTMNAVDTANVATIDLTNNGTLGNTATFGEDDVLLADFDLTPDGEDVLWTGLSMKNGGTNADGIISNLVLIIDGEEVATGSYTGGYAVFAINNFLMKDGDTYTVEVRGDIGVANEGNTIKLYIKDKADAEFIGQQYGYGAQLTDLGHQDIDASSDAHEVTLAAGDFSIDFDKEASPSTEVKPDTDNVVIATLKMTSNGENVTIEDIVDGTAGVNAADAFEIETTGMTAGTELENVELVDLATGGVLSVTATHDGGTTFDLDLDDEDIALVKGQTKTFQVRVDFTATAVDGDTVKVVLGADAMTITGDESNASITDITPSSISSAVTTITEASLEYTVLPLTDVSVVPGAQDITIFAGLLEAGDADDVKLTSFKLSATEGTVGASGTFSDTNITKLDLYLDGVLLKSLSNQIVETDSGDQDATITFNSLSTTNSANVIPAGETVTIEVVARFASAFTNPNWVTSWVSDASTDFTARALDGNDVVTVTTTTDEATIGGAGVAGSAEVSRKTTLVAEGVLTIDLKIDDVRADEDTFVLAGSTSEVDRYLAELEFFAQNEDVKVTDISFNNDGDVTGSDYNYLYLVDENADIVAAATPNADGSVDFTNIDLIFPGDETTSLFLAVDVKGINVLGDATSTAIQGHQFQYSISAVVAEGASTYEDVSPAAAGGGTPAAGEFDDTDSSMISTIVGSKVTSIVNAMSDGVLTGGNNKTIGKFTITFDNGGNRDTANNALKAALDTLTFALAQSVTTVAAPEIYISGTSTYVACNEDPATTVITCDGLDGLADTGKVDGAVTLIVRADIDTTSSEYIQLSLEDLTSGTDLIYNIDGNNDGDYVDTGDIIVTDPLLSYTSVDGGTLSN